MTGPKNRSARRRMFSRIEDVREHRRHKRFTSSQALDITRAELLFQQGYDHTQVAKRLGVSRKWLFRNFPGNAARILRDHRPPRLPDAAEDGERGTAPAAHEIRQRSLEIQKEWSPKERAKRAGIFGRPAVWMPPVVTVAEMEP